MKNLTRSLLFAVVVCFSLNSQAQEQTEATTPTRNMSDLKRKAPIFGTGFLYDTWSRGSVILSDNRSFGNLDLMFDLNRQELSFKAETGETQLFSVPVKEFSINSPDNSLAQPRVFKKGFPKTSGGGNTSTFYEVLIDGNAKLLRRLEAKEIEQPENGYTEKSKQISQVATYFILINNTLTKVNKDKKSILAVLNIKADKVDDYITNNKLDVKDDDAMIAIVKYYNTL